MFFFGLAVLASAAGTFVGFNYLFKAFFVSPGLMWFIFALELILIFTARLWSAIKPLNYFLFSFFAFITGVTLVPILAGVILEFGGPDIIIKALISTTLMFTAAAIFATTTTLDLSGLKGFLWISLIGMIIMSVLGIFWPWSNSMEILFSGFGVVVFSGYTMYDIQRIKNTSFGNPLDAALMLYLDIFNLFIYILRLMSGSRRG